MEEMAFFEWGFREKGKKRIIKYEERNVEERMNEKEGMRKGVIECTRGSV